MYKYAIKSLLYGITAFALIMTCVEAVGAMKNKKR